MAGQKPKCFIMLAGPNIYINIFREFFTLNFLETKFLFTLLWNLMLTFVHFNSNFSHISDIVQTDYLSIIDIFDIDHQQYTDLLMCSILLIMINLLIIITFSLLYAEYKMLTMRAGQMHTYFICITNSSPTPGYCDHFC